MYFVDREKIEKTLTYMEKQILLFEEKDEWATDIEKGALERIAQTIIESILDTGNAMIDGFIMRDPGSYEDIIDILTDEKVITNDMSESLKSVIKFRKMLVQQYIEVDHSQVKSILKEELASLKQFSPKVRDYLTNELGPVSAFKK
ncbi:YutE [Bacillus freudenreichii]|nr:YutE [Bacillus freudenreichii]